MWKRVPPQTGAMGGDGNGSEEVDVSATTSTQDGAPPAAAPGGQLDAARLRVERLQAIEENLESQLDLKVVRAMFFGGFAALPFLWLVAFLHFRKAAKRPHADPRLALYVRRCLVGAVLGGLLFVTWVVVVSTSWRSWGQFGRDLMLVLPWDAQEL